MNNKQDFNFLVEQAMQSTGYVFMRPVIIKELLHYSILFALDKNKLLNKLIFQGGTCLRLCYNAQRFSEDLDFAGGPDFVTKDLIDIKTCLEHHIQNTYGLEITVKEPKNIATEPDQERIKVDKWQISITTSPEQKDIPKQKIKLEISNVPAYSENIRSIQMNYECLPDGYDDLLIRTESLDEIMADKLIALVNCTKYIRYRDIWDLRWLKQQGAAIQSKYILRKIADYKIDDYEEKLEHILNKIETIVHSENFSNEIKRFIPMNTQDNTLKKDIFLKYLSQENKSLLLQVKEIIEAKN